MAVADAATRSIRSRRTDAAGEVQALADLDLPAAVPRAADSDDSSGYDDSTFTEIFDDRVM
jgi:hypothetical protein